jgi:hypothetical protein
MSRAHWRQSAPRRLARRRDHVRTHAFFRIRALAQGLRPASSDIIRAHDGALERCVSELFPG